MKKAKGMQTNSKISEYCSSSISCINAESNTVALITRRNVPLYFMDYLIPTLKRGKRFKGYPRYDLYKVIQDMTCF